MEFVDGITLETWIARNGPPTDLAVPMRIIEEICLGLSAIHAAATIHRDLTPTNILLDANGKPCITDMGLAVLRREGGRLPLETAGTPAYMAPEVAFSREVDPAHRPRSDVYSLACVAYELLTGRPPFRSDSEIKLMIQHAIAAVPRPSRINPAVPLEVDQAIVHALAKDPAARTPTPEAFWCEMSMGQRDPEPERILIAEDDGDSRDAIVGYLQRTFPDAEVEGVGNGFSALAAFDQKPPSIVLLDIRMPGLDGLQVTEWIRRREQWTRIPILIITGSGGPEQWEKLRELGADGFLVKPVSLDDVVALTRRSLRERRSRVSTAVVGSK
jgi:serine/threonine-protein kinase